MSTECALLVLAGCGQAEPSASAETSSQPAVLSSASASAAAATPNAAPTPFTLRRVHSFPKGTSLTWLGAALVACEDGCLVPHAEELPSPKVWLLTGPLAIKEAPELYPEKSIRAYDKSGFYPPALFRKMIGQDRGLAVRFLGRYPGLIAEIDAGTRTGGALPRVRWRDGAWVDLGIVPPEDAYSLSPSQPPPRALDDALMRLPGGRAADVIHGGSGPTIVPAKNKLLTWEGKSWREAPAPWSSPGLGVRLADGRSLVPSREGIFVVDTRGAIEPARAQTDGGETDPKLAWGIYPLGGPVVVRHTDRGVEVHAPANPGAATLANIPAREASSVVDGDEHMKKESPIPPAVAFTDACKTPFVVIATPPSGLPDGSTFEALKGRSDLQDDLVFIVFNRQGVHYFGAQAKTEKAARDLIATLTEKVKGMKPQLSCLDAMAHVPDRYAPPPGTRVLGVNLALGVERRFE